MGLKVWGICPSLVAVILWCNVVQIDLSLFAMIEVVKQVVNAETSRLLRVMQLLCHLILHSLTFNNLFYAWHTPGTSNEIAGALSCIQFHRFQALASEAAVLLDQVPAELWELCGQCKCLGHPLQDRHASRVVKHSKEQCVEQGWGLSWPVLVDAVMHIVFILQHSSLTLDTRT